MSLELFSEEDFRRLCDGGGTGPRVSIYMPTEKAGKEIQQNTIRFKNLLREAEERLGAMDGLRPAEVAALLRPAHELIEDTPFWQHQEEGLALFLSAAGARRYRVPIRLNELVVVNRHFHLKPLLRLLTGDGRFLILTLSQRDIGLWEATRYSMRRLDLGDTPTRLEDVVGSQVEERHLTFRTAAPAPAGRDSAAFHGHGGGTDDVKPEIRKFFNAVDRGVTKIIGGRAEPLVLAGVEFLLPIYREVSDYPHLLAEEVRHGTTLIGPAELHEKAWALVAPRFEAERRVSRERYLELAGTGRTSSALPDVVPAAGDGRVETLFVAAGQRRWGTYDEAGRSVALHDEPGDGRRDLLDLAAVLTLAKGGRVFVVEPDEVPAAGQPLAAIFRY
jgi:hypothetical protein